MFTGGTFLIKKAGDSEVTCMENLTEEQQQFAAAAEEFALKEILPRKNEIEQFDRDLSRKLMLHCGELGLLSVDIPEKYGGLELDKVTSALLAEKITSGQSASFTVTFSAHTGIGTLPIVYFGNETQREKYLPLLGSGEMISAYALTEPGSGSDALSIRSTAALTDDGRYYILNGNKQFISNGGWADILITFAQIDGTLLTGFIVDPRSPGVIIHEEKNKLGLHGSSTCNIILENVKVPAENVLGKIGKGADIAFNSLDIGRFKLGASVLGGCKNTISMSVSYALDRRQFGQAVAKFDAIKSKFADMTIRTYALESIVYQTAGLLDRSIQKVSQDSPDRYQEVAHAIERFAIECSIAKIAGSEALGLNADTGLQIYGGYGFIEDYPLARILRDTRVDRIYEGTNEINRQIILGYLLKKSILEELAVREKVKEIPSILAGKKADFGDSPLGSELEALEIAKSAFLYLFDGALARFGQDLLNEQQIGEILVDMVIDIYLLDTSLTRIIQTQDSAPHPEMLLAVGKVLAAESMGRMTTWSNRLLPGIYTAEEMEKPQSELRQLTAMMYLPTNIFELKKKVADLVYKKKKYPF